MHTLNRGFHRGAAALAVVALTAVVAHAQTQIFDLTITGVQALDGNPPLAIGAGQLVATQIDATRWGVTGGSVTFTQGPYLGTYGVYGPYRTTGSNGEYPSTGTPNHPGSGIAWYWFWNNLLYLNGGVASVDGLGILFKKDTTYINLYNDRLDGTQGTQNLPPVTAQRVTFQVSAVPEPSEWAAMGVLGLALGGLVVRKRRTR